MTEPTAGEDIAAIAKGGRTNFFGFFLRLAARIPFLFIAGRAPAYGPEALGRFASALVVIELTAMLCTLGEQRGLAHRLSDSDEHPANVVASRIMVVFTTACIGRPVYNGKCIDDGTLRDHCRLGTPGSRHQLAHGQRGGYELLQRHGGVHAEPRGVRFARLDVEANGGPFGAGAREPEHDAGAIVEEHADALIRTHTAVDGIGVREIIRALHAT